MFFDDCKLSIFINLITSLTTIFIENLLLLEGLYYIPFLYHIKKELTKNCMIFRILKTHRESLTGLHCLLLFTTFYYILLHPFLIQKTHLRCVHYFKYGTKSLRRKEQQHQFFQCRNLVLRF